jgi:hypothetical protein
VTAQTRFRVISAWLCVAVLMTACSSGGAGTAPAQASGSGPSNAPTSQPEPAAASPDEGTSGSYTRSCETSVFGDLARGWRTDASAVVVGPLAFLYPGFYADAPKSWFGRHHGAYRSQKVLAVIRQGSVVRVSVAPSAEGTASLLYDPKGFWAPRGFEVSDGDRAVTFEACPRGQAALGPPNTATQFNGGFIVAGPRCVPLDARVGNAPPEHFVISFGAGDCNGE